MFEKINRLAEQTVTRASRREFFGHLGRSAMAFAALTGGLLALPTIAQGGPAVTVCGQGSNGACRGKRPGASCNILRATGYCAAAPNCYCRITNPGPPRR